MSQILFDCIFGILFLIIICFYSREIILAIKSILSWTEISFLNDQIRWAMEFLAEFKPNPELDRFLGRVLLDLVRFWNSVTTYTGQFEESSAKYLVAPIGLLGLSFQFAIAYDILVVITIHIHTIFYIFGLAHKISFEILMTLLHMFRGKKYNVLKKKVDDAIYSIEELLLGILVMTIVLFILPTMSIYYLSLIYLMCLIMVFQVVLIILTKTISTLPIFTLLWLKNNSAKIPKNVLIIQIGEKTKNFRKGELSSWKLVPFFNPPTVAFSKVVDDLTSTFKQLSLGLILKSFFLGNAIYPILRNMERDSVKSEWVKEQRFNKENVMETLDA